MAELTASWQGLAEVEADTPAYDQISNLLSTADFEYLRARAIEVKAKLESCKPDDISCTVDLEHFTSGMNNVVFDFSFSDGVHWIARVLYNEDSSEEEPNKLAFLSEVATVKLLHDTTTIPVPKIYDYNTSSAEPFGFPYMLMSRLAGRIMENTLATSIPQQYHVKVARQFANVLHQLHGITRTRIGRLYNDGDTEETTKLVAMDWHALPGPLTTSLEFFHAETASVIREAIENHHDDPEWTAACWVVENALNEFIIKERIQGPFYLGHLDLHYGNLLFDDEYNLTGVLDWSNAQTVPMERMAMSLELTTFSKASDSINDTMQQFRKLVVEALKEMEDEDNAKAISSKGPRPRAPSLSSFIDSVNYDIMYHYVFSNQYQIYYMGKIIANLIYKDYVSWEQLVAAYGKNSTRVV